MAEDIGGAMFTEIFAADIDTNAIKAKGKEAAKAMQDSVAPTSIFQEWQKQLEVFTASATEAFAPVTSGLGEVAIQVSQVAPALSLFKDIAGPVKDFALSLVSKLVPGLVTTTAATGSATTATYALNTAFLSNPAFLVVAGVTALVLAFKSLREAIHKSTEEKLENVKAEQKLIDTQKRSIATKQQDIKENQKLIEEYRILGSHTNKTVEQQERFKEVTQQLQLEYPGTISSTKSFAENLENLSVKSEKGTSTLASLRAEMGKLNEKTDELTIESLELEVEKSYEAIEDTLFDLNATWYDSAQDWIFGISNRRVMVRNSLEEFKTDIAEASNGEEVANSVMKMSDTILSSEGIPTETKQQLLEQIQKFGEDRIKAIDEANLQATQKAGEGSIAFKKAYEDMQSSIDELELDVSKGLTLKAQIDATLNSERLANDLENIQTEIDRISEKGIDNLTETEKNKLEQLKNTSIALKEEIAKIAPAAKSNIGQTVDESGKLVETFDINIDKVKEFSTSQKEVYDDELMNAQNDYTSGMKKLVSSYGEQKKQLEDIANEAARLREEGDNKGAEQQMEIYNSLVERVEESKDKIVDFYKEGVDAGLDNQEVVEYLANTFGISTEEVEKLINAQEKSKEKTKEQQKEAESLGEAWSKARQKASDDISNNIDQLSALEEKLNNKSSWAVGDTEESIKAEIDALKNQTAEIVNQDEKREQIYKKWRIAFGLEQTERVDIIAKAQKEVDLISKKLQNEQRIWELSYNSKLSSSVACFPSDNNFEL
jgi:hypothetical protein